MSIEMDEEYKLWTAERTLALAEAGGSCDPSRTMCASGMIEHEPSFGRGCMTGMLGMNRKSMQRVTGDWSHFHKQRRPHQELGMNAPNEV